MENLSLTASAVISFVGRLEDSTATFYEELAERFVGDKETLLGFAKESRKNKLWVTRTYQETISDALEACFAFQGLNLGEYAVETVLVEGASYSDALKMAIELEKKAIEFYLDVAECSQSLLATIPRAFSRVAKRRGKRKLELESLHNKAVAGC